MTLKTIIKKGSTTLEVIEGLHLARVEAVNIEGNGYLVENTSYAISSFGGEQTIILVFHVNPFPDSDPDTVKGRIKY